MTLPERLRDQVRYAMVVLDALRYGPRGWSDLEKDFFKKSGSHSKFTSIMGWLKENGYIVKDGPPGGRGLNRINREKVSFNENGSLNLKFS